MSNETPTPKIDRGMAVKYQTSFGWRYGTVTAMRSPKVALVQLSNAALEFNVSLLTPCPEVADTHAADVQSIYGPRS
jgi:hypothetical protein